MCSTRVRTVLALGITKTDENGDDQLLVLHSEDAGKSVSSDFVGHIYKVETSHGSNESRIAGVDPHTAFSAYVLRPIDGFSISRKLRTLKARERNLRDCILCALSLIRLYCVYCLPNFAFTISHMLPSATDRPRCSSAPVSCSSGPVAGL